MEFYERVSDRSKYYRFFSPMPHLSDRDVARFTQVDHDQRVAFVMTLQGQMIAVGRYDVVEPGEAEVAFLVEDQHQGRGIAQILLEHLAQAARERGVERFVAEVLPDNQRMIQTFRDAGYRVVSAYDEGVLQLEFPIEPTDTAIGIMQGREHVAEAASIHRFFNPTSVAVIGASRRQDTIGQALVRNLVTGDFTGRVYAVNPSARAVSGLPTYKNVTDIQDDVDVAIVAVPAESVEDVVLDCAAKGVHGLVVISSGFAETGEEGRQRQRRLVGLSRSYGVRLIGPNALGIINTDPAVSINASLAGLMPPRGRAGFFCQSGALGFGDPREGPQPWPRPLDVRQRRQPRRRVRQRPAAVLGGGRVDRGRDDVPRVDRQPPQVLPDRPPGLAAQADHRGPLRPHHPGRPDGPRGPQDRGAAAGRGRDVPAGRGDPGGHPRGHVRRRPARGAPAAAARPPGRDRRATPTRWGCWPRTPRPRSGWWSTSRSR